MYDHGVPFLASFATAAITNLDKPALTLLAITMPRIPRARVCLPVDRHNQKNKIADFQVKLAGGVCRPLGLSKVWTDGVLERHRVHRSSLTKNQSFGFAVLILTG